MIPLTDNELIAFMAKLADNPTLLVRMVEVVGKAQYENGKEAGRKEMVKWLLRNDFIKRTGSMEWQALLKEVGMVNESPNT